MMQWLLEQVELGSVLLWVVQRYVLYYTLVYVYLIFYFKNKIVSTILNYIDLHRLASKLRALRNCFQLDLILWQHREESMLL